VTFNKRKNGLLKKAMELSLLCDSSVALIIMNNSAAAKERVFEYCSTEMDKHLVHYMEVTEPGVIKYTNTDYYKLFGKKGSVGGSDGECSPDEGLSQTPILHHHHQSPALSISHSQLHQETSREGISTNAGTVPTSQHPSTSYPGYAVAIQHKEHYPIHGQSFEDFLKQSNYGPIFDASPSSYFEGPGQSSVSHEHPSQHHGTLFCPPIQLSKDLLPSHLSHAHTHPFPFSLGVPISSPAVMGIHSFPTQDPPFSGPHREREMNPIFPHPSHHNNHQGQTSQMTSTPIQTQQQQHGRPPKDPLSISLGDSPGSSSAEPTEGHQKKRKLEKSST